MAIGVVSALRSEQSNGIEFWVGSSHMRRYLRQREEDFWYGFEAYSFHLPKFEEAMLVTAAHLEWL